MLDIDMFVKLTMIWLNFIFNWDFNNLKWRFKEEVLLAICCPCSTFSLLYLGTCSKAGSTVSSLDCVSSFHPLHGHQSDSLKRQIWFCFLAIYDLFDFSLPVEAFPSIYPAMAPWSSNERIMLSTARDV